MIYVDSQGVVLMNGIEASVELEWDEETDTFVVRADSEMYIDNLKDFHKENYPDDDWSEMYKEARGYCKNISGIYPTLQSVNLNLENYCSPNDYYNFTWEYDDGTLVE